jgi:hypothetical protein
MDYVILNSGASTAIGNQTAQQPVVEYALSNAGLMANLGLDGTKTNKLDLWFFSGGIRSVGRRTGHSRRICRPSSAAALLVHGHHLLGLQLVVQIAHHGRSNLNWLRQPAWRGLTNLLRYNKNGTKRRVRRM